MSEEKVRWEINYRHVKLRSDELTSVGLNLYYRDRECEVCIGLSPPIHSTIPETTVILGELHRLRAAIDQIIDEQQTG